MNINSEFVNNMYDKFKNRKITDNKLEIPKKIEKQDEIPNEIKDEKQGNVNYITPESDFNSSDTTESINEVDDDGLLNLIKESKVNNTVKPIVFSEKTIPNKTSYGYIFGNQII